MIRMFLAVAVLVGLSGLALWWHGGAHSAPASAVQESAAPLGTSTATAADPHAPLGPHRTPPTGEREYYNEQYRFSFLYPDDLTIQSYDEGGGAQTITFQNASTVRGFQIFIVPYSGPQVSAQRFAQDEPSGVREGLHQVSLDGATGASFYGQDSLLGPTAEVWVLRGGYLYEISAPKPQALWLAGIIESWKFD